MITMRALTLTPPWGSLIALAAAYPSLGKRVETRSWPLPARYAGALLAIHQAKTLPPGFSEQELAELCASPPFAEALATLGITSAAELPRGKVIAVVVPRASCPITDDGVQMDGGVWYPEEPEHSFGNYAPGRWAWPLEHIKALASPVPCRGRQRLWPLSQDVAAQVWAQL